MNKNTKKYCIISHTHWDREWYIPLENFRMRLVDLMDHLLDILDTDPGYRFHLDAQTIVLEDYLEIRPTRREKLEGYIKEGRLLVGPWYVQNDFHLTSGEATVRNLLIGTKIANDFGKCMQVGYAADQFGLCSQLPQILYRYGLDNCIFGRGFARGESQFYWQSEDGSRILCEHMFAWYNNAQRFSSDPTGALALARMRGEACAARGKTHNYLMMNGVDHLEAQEDLSEIIEKVQPLLNEDEAFFQDTMPEYIQRVKDEIAEDNIELTTYTGEFRDLGACNVLTGTLASRVYLKQYNARLQAMLEKQFEPLYALTSAMGLGEYPQEYGNYMWKVLVQNHPHDSICGCSVDAVHNHMMDRFERIEENVTDLISRGGELLLSHIDRTGLNDRQYLIANLNTTPLTYDGVMQAVIDIPVEEDTGAFTLSDTKGKNIPFEVVSVVRNLGKRILSPINLPGGKQINRYTVRYRATVEGMSYRILVVTPAEGTLAVAETRRKSAYHMENENLKVTIHSNGTVDLKNKKTGKVYENLLWMEDNADRGSSYNYYENDGSEIVTSLGAKAKARVIEDTPLMQKRGITYRMKIDREIGSGTVDFDVVLTLGKGDKMLGVDIRIDNQCIRHRLRVCLPTGIVSDINYAGQPYDIVTRTKISKYNDDKTHPNTDFVGIDAPEGDHGFAVLNCGLYEYEHMTDDNEGTLALTLLRSVRRITGATVEGEDTMEQEWVTPEGVCLGEQNYHLALYPYAGNHEDAAVAARTQQFMSMPYTAVQGVDRNKFIGGRPFVQGPGMPDLFYRPLEYAEVVLPRDFKLFRIADETVKNAMILSACKGAEARDGSHIVRLYNSTSQTVDFKLVFGRRVKAVEEVNLAEKPVASLRTIRGAVALTAAPKQIITLRVVF